MTPDEVVEHIRDELQRRFSWLTLDELEQTVRSRDDDPGEWCGEDGIAWINSENGLGSWSYESVIFDALWHIAPDGYWIEPVNAAVAVVYRD